MAFLAPNFAINLRVNFSIASYASTFAARPSRAALERTCFVMAVSPKAFDTILAVRLAGNLSLIPFPALSPRNKCLLSMCFVHTTNARGKERVVDWTAILITIVHTSPSSVQERGAVEHVLCVERWLHIGSLSVSKTVRTPRQKKVLRKNSTRVTFA